MHACVRVCVCLSLAVAVCFLFPWNILNIYLYLIFRYIIIYQLTADILTVIWKNVSVSGTDKGFSGRLQLRTFFQARKKCSWGVHYRSQGRTFLVADVYKKPQLFSNRGWRHLTDLIESPIAETKLMYYETSRTSSPIWIPIICLRTSQNATHTSKLIFTSWGVINSGWKNSSQGHHWAWLL